MFIFELLKQRKYNNGKAPNDKDYESYYWVFNPIDQSLEIHLTTPNHFAFSVYSVEERISAQTKKQQQMLEKLEHTLIKTLNLRKSLHFKITQSESEEIYLIRSNPQKYHKFTMTITDKGIKEICYQAIQASKLKANEIPNELLPPIAALAPNLVDLNTINIPQDSLDYFQALLYLDQYIFNHPKKSHPEKAQIIKIVETIFLKVKNTDDLCKLYDYINLKNNKEKINIHLHNIADTIFFWKSNTKSWQSMLTTIRSHAYNTLIAEANDKTIVETATPYLAIPPLEAQDMKPHPHDQLSYLKKYRNQKLFTDHKTNNPFCFIYNTKTTQDMDNKINMLEQLSDMITTEKITLSI